MTGRTNASAGNGKDFNFLAIIKNNISGSNKGDIQSPVWRFNGITYQTNQQMNSTWPTRDTSIATITRLVSGALSVTLKIKCKATGFVETDGVYDAGSILTVNTITSAYGVYYCAFLIGV